ncbi:sugar ABC transporter substrate-binding protein [Streptomyces deccanensis]|uniref:sugar ABC transporter substrate-binding protein n=1 Tax=Streptomyces deccanensis TaxID=424188 RepID=UPI001EFB04A4|nr:sugar ABC transporter substrate-binding protein [Streptomyces deccanensis]ULR51137.1 sugar ABC transporter substrate-binding protein [Streptomyces deccanensis]
MKLARTWSTAAAATAVLTTLALATACYRGAASEDDRPTIGIDVPRSDSDFWNSYVHYLKKDIRSAGVDDLPVTNSQNDVHRLIANMEVLQKTGGADAIIMAPQDSGAIASTLDALADEKIPVISVDTRPDEGDVYMVVRADNRAYGTKACEFLGEQLDGEGKVAELQGALDSINGRDRSEAFAECMETKFPKIRVFELPTDWEGDVASTKLQSLLAQHPDLGGIYMQAGGVFLHPTLEVLEENSLLKPAGEKGHITVVSNDGIPQEFDAIREGYIDATVSQPADLYAKYAVYYAKAATEGRTFKPGPTDHGSTIVELPNGLEDQLPAPLVTKENVDDRSMWANSVPR